MAEPPEPRAGRRDPPRILDWRQTDWFAPPGDQAASAPASDGAPRPAQRARPNPSERHAQGAPAIWEDPPQRRRTSPAPGERTDEERAAAAEARRLGREQRAADPRRGRRGRSQPATAAGARPVPPAADEAAAAETATAPGGSTPAATPDTSTEATGQHATPAAHTRAGVARNTAIFSVATGLSRVAGLVREIVAARYFGTAGPASAFTLAFQIPNLVRSLFADAALSAAFVPVFTELLEKGKKADAARLAGSLLAVMVAVLSAVCVLFILLIGVVMPFITPEYSPALQELATGLSRVLFPIVLLLGVNGLVVGVLNAQGHFSVPAISPLVWNVVIIGGLIALEPLFEGGDRLYAYAIAIVLGTLAQLLMVLPVLRRVDVGFDLRPQWRDPRLKRIFTLMVPITLGLGIINFDVLIASFVGGLVSDEVPAAIDKAFRVYMLPQGMFSVAVATVLFPTLSRLAARRDLDGLRSTMASGVRQIWLLLVPAAAFTIVLAHPIVRLLYERGAFDARSTDLTATALVYFSIALPFSGINLLLTRTAFSLQQPWIPTRQALINVTVNAVVALALYKPLGIAAPVLGTVLASISMTVGLTLRLRPLLGGGLEGRRSLDAGLRILVASAALAAVSYATWRGVTALAGDALVAELAAVGLAGALGLGVYVAAVRALRVEEYHEIERLVRRRLGR